MSSERAPSLPPPSARGCLPAARTHGARLLTPCQRKLRRGTRWRGSALPLAAQLPRRPSAGAGRSHSALASTAPKHLPSASCATHVQLMACGCSPPAAALEERRAFYLAAPAPCHSCSERRCARPRSEPAGFSLAGFASPMSYVRCTRQNRARAKGQQGGGLCEQALRRQSKTRPEGNPTCTSTVSSRA